jgi:hypothetical protein
MRIALQTDTPGLGDQLQSLAPGIEASVLPRTDEHGKHRIVADVLLDTAAGY